MKEKLLCLLFVALFLSGLGLYSHWYMSLPIVKKTTDGTVVGVEIKGEEFGPEKKLTEKYLVQWVSYEWKPETK